MANERARNSRRRSVTIVLAASLLVGAGSTLSSAASAAPSTLHLNAAVYDVHTSKSGVVSSKEKLTQGTTAIGEDFSRCAPASKTTVRCVGSYTLTRGTLQISGTIPASGDVNHLAVVGGTGAYRSAHGTVVTEYNKAGTKAKETITFR
jgi:Dirigent-like protein